MTGIVEKEEFGMVYRNVRTWLKKTLKSVPEDYIINNFIDPVHFWSMDQHLKLGSPYAHLSSTFVRHLNHVREKGLISKNLALVYVASPTQIYLNTDRIVEISKKENVAIREVLAPVLVNVLAKAFLAEFGKLNSTNRRYLTEIQDIDLEIRTLLLNNLYFLKIETQTPWIGQYLQDFSAFVRFLTKARFDEWHIPSKLVQEQEQHSHYSNFIIEVIPALKERAQIVRNCFLTDILFKGFSQFLCSRYFQDVGLETLRSFNPCFQPPGDFFAFSCMHEVFSYFNHSFSDFLSFVLNIQSDYHLLTALSSLDPLSILNKCEKEATGKLSVTAQGIVLGAWYELRQYVKNLIAYELTSYGNFLQWQGKNFRGTNFIGVLPWKKPIYIFRFEGEPIAAEQLLFLHNHANPKADPFSLPGVAIIFALQHVGKMNVLTQFEVDLDRSKPVINSPWDLAMKMRSVRVVSRDYDPKRLKILLAPELSEMELTT
ncbi:MAG: hypothetical protein ACFFBD_00645, partial [Candidatus Hodarchaeota archaeon]